MSSDESTQVKFYSPRVTFEVPKDKEQIEVPRYSLMDILFDDEAGLVNEVGWLLLQNLKEEDLHNFQLLRCRREGGGEHRAEQSNCSS